MIFVWHKKVVLSQNLSAVVRYRPEYVKDIFSDPLVPSKKPIDQNTHFAKLLSAKFFFV